MVKQRTANSSLAKGGLTCFVETFVLKQTFVFRMDFGAKNPALRQARKRQAVKKPNFNIYLQKNNAKISLEFASACLPESVFQTAIFC